MERKIGEIFEYNGEWYQCVEGLYCDNCAFVNDNCEDRERITLREKLTKQPTTGFCNSEKRNDRKPVIFKKLEKVGEPYTNGCKLFQRYKLFTPTNKLVNLEIKQNKEDMEEKKLNLKPFDIQKAREGKPVCTRDGRKVRIICFDRKGGSPVIALVETFVKEYDCIREDSFYYTVEGRAVGQNTESKDDLMMLPERKGGWVNIVRGSDGSPHMGRGIFQLKEEAENTIKAFSDNLIDTVKICWEE